MPGIVVFKRRWSVGSDDFVVPAVFLAVLHVIWIIALAIILAVVEFDKELKCATNLYDHVLGYLVILSGCVIIEGSIAWVSMRGTILNAEPRASMQYLLYVRLGVLLLELAWLIVGVIWVTQHYHDCAAASAKRAILGIIVCNWAVLLSVIISLWCTFDTAGRSWVKMKKYQESVKIRETRAGQKRRSGSRRRNWRNRKAIRAYEESWDRRCRLLFCCVQEDRHRNSFAEVAKLFTEFFRDLDVVPSDILAGLVLLRKQQKLRRKFVVQQTTNEVYQFLSGVPVTPATQFLCLQNPVVLADFKQVIYYMRYALAAYGWPLYMMMNTRTGLCRMLPKLRCCMCCSHRGDKEEAEVVEDNCCQCNLAALKLVLSETDIDLIYVTYHVDIGETPFYIAVDHTKKQIIISIRGTLSLQDVLTDLKADAEPLPVNPPKEEWLGHKGMVQAAVYIKKRIKEEMLLSKAFGRDLDRGTQQYDLVLVGHSLGAGTAAILAILLHQEYPSLQCFAYSPPGGLLSETCVEDTKHFITSVVVGKDVVPRIGLHQLEALRQDLINVIKQSAEPKWKVIAGSVMCCCCAEDDNGLSGSMFNIYENQRVEKEQGFFAHPSDSQIALTSHTPLYLPGKIIHVVRNHPRDKKMCKRAEPVYQAIWADKRQFDEVLISPTMVNDHMPDNVMEALEKVLTNIRPAKPTRQLTEAERRLLLAHPDGAKRESYCPQCEAQESPHMYHSRNSPHFNNSHNNSPRFYLSNQSGIDISKDLSGAPEELIQAHNVGCESSSMTWDYATLPLPNTRRSPTPSKEAGVNRAERTKSFPPPVFRLQPGMRLDSLGNPEWNGPCRIHAPLASPETLSEASSVDTIHSKRLSDGFQKLQQQNSFSKLEPIPPSPLRPNRSDIPQFFTPGAADLIDISGTPSQSITNGVLQDPTEPLIDSIKCVPLAQSTPIKPEAVPLRPRNNRPVAITEPPADYNDILLDISNTLGAQPDPQDGSQPSETQNTEDSLEPCVGVTETSLSGDLDQDNTSLGVSPLPDCVIPLEDPNQTNLTDIEQRIDDKLKVMDSNDPYRITFGDITADSGTSDSFARHSLDSFPRHSPDSFARHSPDSLSNQFVYDEMQGHYSPAGRGYPHGGYMANNRSIEPPQSLPVNGQPLTAYEIPQIDTDSDNHSFSSAEQKINKRDSPIYENILFRDNNDFQGSRSHNEILPIRVHSGAVEPITRQQDVPQVIIDNMCGENVNNNENTSDLQSYMEDISSARSPTDELPSFSVECEDHSPVRQDSADERLCFELSEQNPCPINWDSLTSNQAAATTPSPSGNIPSPTSDIPSPTAECSFHPLLSTSASDQSMEDVVPSPNADIDFNIETESVHAPLLIQPKRASWASSTSSRSSRKTLTNGHSTDSSPASSPATSPDSSPDSSPDEPPYSNHPQGQRTKVNGVKVKLTDSPSFGETYYV